MVEVLDPAARRQGRVRHEHVHGAGGLGESARRVAFGEVGHEHLGPVAKACPKLVQGVPAAAAQQHPRAALVKSARDRVADAACRPGDQSGLSAELHAAEANNPT